MMSYNHPIEWLQKAHPDTYFHVEVSGDALVDRFDELVEVYPGGMLHIEAQHRRPIGMLAAPYRSAAEVRAGFAAADGDRRRLPRLPPVVRRPRAGPHPSLWLRRPTPTASSTPASSSPRRSSPIGEDGGVLAALITGAASVELREFPEPEPTPEGVVVDIAFCGICGTDVHAYQSGRPYNPAICGHEWAGTVSAVGRDVRSLHEGDRVVVGAAPACGNCVACRAGQAERCQTAFRSAIGRDALAPPHGGFAPRIGVAASRVVPTDPALTDEQAAQVEPTTVSFHAVRTSRLRLGDTAVVQGAGPIGLGTLQWVRAAGAGRVIVVEPNATRRELARALGADDTVDAGADARTVIDERTRGLGADIVYECVGRPAAIQAAVDLARRGGSVCLIGLANEDASITPARG